MKPASRNFRKAILAFTLVETLMAVTIMGLTSIGIVAFLRQGLKMYYADRARVLINRDMRTFTSQLDTDAVTANFFLIYPSFGNLTTGSGNSTADAAVADGQVGDLLVLVYTDPSTTSQGISMVTEMIGYYREVTDTTLNSGPVHRFDVKLGTSVSVKSQTLFSTIISNNVTGNISSYPVVEQLAQGLATNATGTTPTPTLFYNLKNRSVMVNAQIAESLSEKGTLSQAGNTYNFAVSPRG